VLVKLGGNRLHASNRLNQQAAKGHLVLFVVKGLIVHCLNPPIRLSGLWVGRTARVAAGMGAISGDGFHWFARAL
jgi:hypothetical protein